jgi:hypothetical protein
LDWRDANIVVVSQMSDLRSSNHDHHQPAKEMQMEKSPRRSLAAVIGAPIAAGPIWILSFGIAPRLGIADAPIEKEKRHFVDLSWSYTTSAQGELRKIKFERGSAPAKALAEVEANAGKIGASNVLLVRATDIADAIIASSRAFGGGRGADTPIPPRHADKGRNIWLVAYFGTSSSSPIVWEVQSVERIGKRIRVSFVKQSEGDFTADVHPYFAWCPLEELDFGSYSLELYDAKAKEVLLSRLVRYNEDQ